MPLYCLGRFSGRFQLQEAAPGHVVVAFLLEALGGFAWLVVLWPLCLLGALVRRTLRREA
jgi:hypothetical protein